MLPEKSEYVYLYTYNLFEGTLNLHFLYHLFCFIHYFECFNTFSYRKSYKTIF